MDTGASVLITNSRNCTELPVGEMDHRRRERSQAAQAQDYANFGISAQTRPPFAPYPEINCGAGASTRAQAFYPRRTL